MSTKEKETGDAEEGSTQATGDVEPVVKKEEETIPILKLTVVSKKGTTPSDMAGSLEIPIADDVNSERLTFTQKSNIVDNGQLPIPPNWQVLVTVREDNLLNEIEVKGSKYQKYVCINALLSFHKEIGKPDTHLLSEDIIPGEWLLPVKVGEGNGKLLAYVGVKIEDQPDKPTNGGTSDQSKSGSNTKNAAK